MLAPWRTIQCLSAFAMLTLMGLITSHPANAQEALRTLVVKAQAGRVPTIEVEINRQSVRLELAADAPRFVMLNPGVAQRLGLRSNPILSRGVRIDMRGHVYHGRTGRARIQLPEHKSYRTRMIWFEDLSFSNQADGVIGLAGLRELDRLILQIGEGAQEGFADLQQTRLSGTRGLEWIFHDETANPELEIRLSFSRQSSVNTPTQRRLEREGRLAAASDELVFAHFWFLENALAFEHANQGLEIAGLRPERFLAFASPEQVQAHTSRLEYERNYGPIETITVRSPVGRSSRSNDQITLGVDVLMTCQQLAFDFIADQVFLTCLASASQQ